MIKSYLGFAVSTLFVCDLAMAGVCKIHFKREACPGKEKESYSKCEGKQECDQAKKAANLEECQKLAAQACANTRFLETKTKVITAQFDGKPIKDADGKDDFCLSYANIKTEFNQCK